MPDGCRFKIGDSVMLRSDAKGLPGYFTHGKFYEVGGIFYTRGHDGARLSSLGVVQCDSGRPDAWYIDEFEFAGGPW